MQFRRKNGEPFWNIAKVRSHVSDLQEFTDKEILEFIEFLKKNGIEVQMAKMDYERILPITEEETIDYIEPDTKGWCTVDSISILESQKNEESWENDIIEGISESEKELSMIEDQLVEINEKRQRKKDEKQKVKDDFKIRCKNLEKKIEDWIAEKGKDSSFSFSALPDDIKEEAEKLQKEGNDIEQAEIEAKVMKQVNQEWIKLGMMPKETDETLEFKKIKELQEDIDKRRCNLNKSRLVREARKARSSPLI